MKETADPRKLVSPAVRFKGCAKRLKVLYFRWNVPVFLRISVFLLAVFSTSAIYSNFPMVLIIHIVLEFLVECTNVFLHRVRGHPCTGIKKGKMKKKSDNIPYEASEYGTVDSLSQYLYISD